MQTRRERYWRLFRPAVPYPKRVLLLTGTALLPNSQPTLTQVVNGRRGLSPETCLRLARYFGVDAQWFVNLQAYYELRQAEKRSLRAVARITPLAALAA